MEITKTVYDMYYKISKMADKGSESSNQKCPLCELIIRIIICRILFMFKQLFLLLLHGYFPFCSRRHLYNKPMCHAHGHYVLHTDHKTLVRILIFYSLNYDYDKTLFYSNNLINVTI